jgi:hypothetical protein
MEAKGRIETLTQIQFLIDSKDKVKDKVFQWMRDKKRIRFHITGEAVVSGTAAGGIVFLEPPDGSVGGCDVSLKTWYRKGSRSQLNTLKGLESLIYQADNGIAPPSSDDLWFIHQGIMEAANIQIYNTKTESSSLVTCSSPFCDSSAMNRYIEIALDELSMRDIPENVRDSINGETISDLFVEWYKKRMVEDDLHSIKNWESYKSLFPWCEFTFTRGTEDNPLEWMHIVTRGAHPERIDEPWNWIHGSASIHRKQHLYGWDSILQDYPHMIPKVKKARELANQKEGL